MTGVLHGLLNAPAWIVLGLVGLVVFSEDALFVGFVFPGETAAVLGGVAASRGHVALFAVLAVVLLGAVIGDSVGYEVGRHVGTRIMGWHVLQRRRERIDAASDFLARRGGGAVFLGRWTAFFRAVMPALAGTARMPYRRFLTFNVAGGVLWGVTVVLVGYVAGASYGRVEELLGRGTALVVAVLVVVAVVVWQVRGRRTE
jgi:membrane-associated protein